jgi:hypothetical protein
MKQTNNIYGVLIDGVHIDVSNTERGAKQYATKNGYSIITVRYNCGYIASRIACKCNGKWRPITQTNN